MRPERPNYEAMSTEELRAILDKKALEIIDGLINGGGSIEQGLGERLDNSMSMTDATECYWGMSGRGSQNAKARIRGVASLDYVKVTRKGRTERVSNTEKGLALYRAAKAADLLPSNPTRPFITTLTNL